MTDEDDEGADVDTSHPLALSRSVREAAILSRPSGPPPVFLHASFRTGSTWLWQKLRSAPTTLAYYEIFHEVLATLTPAECKKIDFATWDSRHPPSSPYLLEFLPLIEPPGGIVGFDHTMSFGSFIPTNGPNGDLSVPENAYVNRLISAARATERIPVLSCTRSLGRARAVKRAVGGQTILLCRNLFHQWASYCWQAETKNTYFLDTIYKTVAGARHDAFLRNLSDWFGMGEASLPPEELFEVFVVLHLYLYAFAFDATDLVVDVSEIATDRSARRHVEDEISDMVRHDIDLSDVREHCEFTSTTIGSAKKMRDTIEQFAKLVPTDCISSRAVQFVEATKTRALIDWDRHEFFSRRTRSVLTTKVEETEARLAERDAEADGLAAERDRLSEDLTASTAALQAEQTAREAAIRVSSAERDTLHAALVAIGSEHYAEAQKLLQTEASSESGALQAAMLAVCEAAMKSAEDRSQLKQQLASLEATRNRLEQSLADVERERATSLSFRARRLLSGRSRRPW